MLTALEQPHISIKVLLVPAEEWSISVQTRQWVIVFIKFMVLVVHFIQMEMTVCMYFFFLHWFFFLNMFVSIQSARQNKIGYPFYHPSENSAASILQGNMFMPSGGRLMVRLFYGIKITTLK